MATWTEIPNSSIETGRPIRAIDGRALRDNVVALAEGASGAPKIETAAIDDLAVTAGKLATGNNERDWVLDRTAGASVGAVGTYAFLGETGNVTTNPGGTRAGSALRYANVIKFDTSDQASASWASTFLSAARARGGSSAPAGTWRAMGFNFSENTSFDISRGATLWLRIS